MVVLACGFLLAISFDRQRLRRVASRHAPRVLGFLSETSRDTT